LVCSVLGFAFDAIDLQVSANRRELSPILDWLNELSELKWRLLLGLRFCELGRINARGPKRHRPESDEM